MTGSYLFSSESVSEGHPDKVCDRISDELLDAFFRADPQSRVACETMTTTNRIVIAGEVRGTEPMVDADGRVDQEAVANIAREAVKNIGYAQNGFHWRFNQIDVLLHGQSADIAQGVDAAGNKDEGAGDQGIMFGYACRETEELMPAPIQYSHAILHELARVRHAGEVKGLGPDSKSQLTVRYEGGKPAGVASVVVSTQHSENLSQKDVEALVRPVVEKALPEGWLSSDTDFYVNPTGSFVIGGPDGDCGLTGRKIIVDTYGGAAPHGGGAFSGKDPTKVDRSAAYAARYLAKNVVAAGAADRCTIQLAYAIGVSQPLSVYVNTHGTGRAGDDKISAALREVMDLSPRGIREHLALNKPIFARTAAYGHFGRAPDADGGFSWEKTDLAEALKAAL